MAVFSKGMRKEEHSSLFTKCWCVMLGWFNLFSDGTKAQKFIFSSLDAYLSLTIRVPKMSKNLKLMHV